MSLFQQIGDSQPRPVAEWAPPIACLAVSALLTMGLARRNVAWPGALPYAVLWIAFVFAVGAGVGWALNRRSLRHVLPFAAAGVWFVPLATLIAQHSVWSIPIAGLLAISIAKLLRWFEEIALTATENLQPDSLKSHFLDGACAQTGILFMLMGRMAAASFCIGLCCLLSAWSADRKAYRPGTERILGRLGLAMIFTTLLLIPPGIPKTNEATPTNAPPGVIGAKARDDLYSGVILIPESNKAVKIVAPPVHARVRSPFGRTRTIVIPFSGEYWFFYYPLRRPPKDSLVQRGTPVSFKFTATGKTFLSMEAIQKIGAPIPLQNCSRIDVAINNADPLPGTVSLELILKDTAATPARAQSLGEMAVSSAAEQTLQFFVPVHGSLRKFDEIAVTFGLRNPRMQRSANIAIERFELIPRW